MKQTIYTMTEDELKTQNEKWEKFLAKYNCNHYYVILATKEYEERLNFYGITSESPDSLKAKAEDLPVVFVEIGQDHCTPTFYAQFHMGSRALGEPFFYPEGCNYFTYNVMNTICNECGYISKHTLDTCPKCGSKDVDYATRIIGYLKRISAFSAARQIEADNRAYNKLND